MRLPLYPIFLLPFCITFTPVHTQFELTPMVLERAGVDPQALLNYIKERYDAKKHSDDTAKSHAFPSNIIQMVKRLVDNALLFTEKIDTRAEISSQKNNNFSLSELFIALELFSKRLLANVRHLVHTSLDEQYDLTWCSCRQFLPHERIFFIIQLILDIEQQFPDKKKPVVYTSLASGGLLQDYLTIQELILSGYNNIVINIIDAIYPDLTKLPKTYADRIKQLNKLKSSGKEKSPEASIIENSLRIENFQYHLGVLASNHPEIKPSLNFNYFRSAHEYIMDVDDGMRPKTTVLIMVDPDRPAWYKATPETPASAINMILLQKTPEPGQDDNFYLTLSSIEPLHVYYNRGQRNEADTMDYLSCMSMLTQSDVHWIQHMHKGRPQQKFNQEAFGCLKTHNLAYKEGYISAHIDFQELAVKCCTDNALIYVAADVFKDIESGKRIKKLDKKKLATDDYIDATIGTEMKYNPTLNTKMWNMWSKSV